MNDLWVQSDLNSHKFYVRWIRMLDAQFRRANRKICLLVDNFKGHLISYEPTNIHIEFMAPNMTSFIQPLDAGIIRCFKAHYRHATCMRAIEQDDAGEQDIYKIDLLEAMLLVNEAWSEVSQATIANCWQHTKIEQDNRNESVNNNE